MMDSHSSTATIDLLAENAHAGQVDKSGQPYIAHPRAVASLVVRVPAFAGLDVLEQVTAVHAALLHDVLEDTPVTAADLAAFGVHRDTLAVVELLTFRGGDDRSAYYAGIAADRIARVVKLADVAHNTSPERVAALPEQTRARLARKYAVTVQALTAGHPDDLAWIRSVQS